MFTTFLSTNFFQLQKEGYLKLGRRSLKVTNLNFKLPTVILRSQALKLKSMRILPISSLKPKLTTSSLY